MFGPPPIINDPKAMVGARGRRWCRSSSRAGRCWRWRPRRTTAACSTCPRPAPRGHLQTLKNHAVFSFVKFDWFFPKVKGRTNASITLKTSYRGRKTKILKLQICLMHANCFCFFNKKLRYSTSFCAKGLVCRFATLSFRPRHLQNDFF